MSQNPSRETIIFGGGCFWCTEAIFQSIRGVTSVTSGYAGGSMSNPTYEDIISKKTGHAEVIKIDYDSSIVTLQDLIEVFFDSHDPTTLNRQGNDIGEQYRSLIFYTTEAQKINIEEYIQDMESSHKFSNPIVTELKPANMFYPAEDYHQQYYKKNSGNPYCQIVISPKLEKLQKEHGDLLM